MNILVTGASGLVGNAICDFFLNRGYLVTGLVNSSRGNIYKENYRELSIDLTKEFTVLKDEKFDAVIHCAAIIPKGILILTEEEIEEKNQQIDHAVFNFSKKNSIKIIYFSTSFFYNANEDGLLSEATPIDENARGYYRSKQNSEKFLAAEAIDSVVFRVSSPYGNLEKQNNVIKVFSENIKNNLPVKLINQGERKQNFIHLDDIAEACFRILDNRHSGIYNLAYKDNYSMLELATLLKKIFNSTSEFIFDKSKSEQQQNVNFDITKIKRTLNWEPSIDLYTGLRKTLNK